MAGKALNSADGRERHHSSCAQRRAEVSALRDAWARVGCSGCAVGLLGVVLTAYWALMLSRGPAHLLIALAALLAMVPFVVCWLRPSLSWLMLVVLLGTEGVFFLFVVAMETLFQ